MDEATQKLVDEAVAKARAEFAAELKATQSALEKWVVAHPVAAFRAGVVAGILMGGFAVFGTIKVFG